MNAYFISGLAADRRVFKHIVLPSRYKIIHLDWIMPLSKESLSTYALRLAQGIDTTSPFILVGLSMGGMMASEIAKRLHPVLTVLISAVPVDSQLPTYFRWAHKLNLQKLLPVKWLKHASVVKRIFMPETPDDKAIIRQVIRDSDPEFIKWAIEAILTWKNEIKPAPLLHIHGSRDEVLPVRFTRPTHIIQGGTHLMVMGRAAEINAILSSVLDGRLDT